MIVTELVAMLGLKLNPTEWAKGDSLVDGLKGAFVGLLAALGLNEIKGMIESVIEMGGALTDTSASLGVAIEDLQELRFAASLAGISAGELDGAIRKYSRGLEEAKKGKGPVADAFRSLKISMDEIKKGGIADNLELIADRFSKMPDGPKKTALAMDLFGRSGAQLIPMLNEGREGVAELRREANELGIVMSSETAGGFDEVGDNIDRTKAALQGVKMSIVTALLPSIKDMVDSLLAWVKANREIIANAVHLVVQAGIVAFKLLAVVVGSLVDIFNWFRDGSDEAMAVLIAIAAVITATVVPALVQMAAAWLLAAGPVILTVAAIAAVVYGIIKLIRHWDLVRAAAGRAWDFIKRKVSDFWNFIKSIPGRILQAFEDLGEGIIKALVKAFDFVVDRAKQAASIIWDEVKNIPVIGDIAAGAEWVVGQAAGLNSPVDSLNSQVGSMVGMSSGGTANVTNTYNINQQPGESAENLAKRIADHDASARRAAFDAVRGGVQ